MIGNTNSRPPDAVEGEYLLLSSVGEYEGRQRANELSIVGDTAAEHISSRRHVIAMPMATAVRMSPQISRCDHLVSSSVFKIATASQQRFLNALLFR